jgi:hypothetical protein
LCAVVLCVAQGIFGYPFRKTIALAAPKFVPVERFAYSTPILAQYTPKGAQATSARLYEDTRAFALYSQRTTSVSGIGRGIFTFPEKGRLVFSSSDNSDPRTNGRMYRIEVPHRLSGGVLMICLGAWLAILAIHLAALPDRRTALMVWRRSAGFALESLVRLVRAIGAAVLIGAIAVGLNDWIAKSMIVAFHDEYRSTPGWTLSDRVQVSLIDYRTPSGCAWPEISLLRSPISATGDRVACHARLILSGYWPSHCRRTDSLGGSLRQNWCGTRSHYPSCIYVVPYDDASGFDSDYLGGLRPGLCSSGQCEDRARALLCESLRRR